MLSSAILVEVEGHPLWCEGVGEEEGEVGDLGQGGSCPGHLHFQTGLDQVDGDVGVELCHELAAGAAGTHELVSGFCSDRDRCEVLLTPRHCLNHRS